MLRLIFGAVFVVFGSLTMAEACKVDDQGAMVIAGFLLLTGFLLPRKKNREVHHFVPVFLTPATVVPKRRIWGTLMGVAIIVAFVIAILHGGGK